MFSKGRLIGAAFSLFALICLISTFDFSRGRVPETNSPLVAEVLAATTARECGRDATEIVGRYLPLGMAQADAEAVLATISIVPPKPWFWTPMVENATTWTGQTLEALHTIKATAFGTNLLRIYLGFEDGKVKRVAAEVVCHFG